jgi:O-antigen ligase
MRTWPDQMSLGLAAPKVSWRVSAPLALFAFGIPVDSTIASQIGSTSIVLGVPLVGTACWHMLVTNRLRPLPGSLLLMVAFAAWGAVSVLWARDGDLLQIRTMTTAQLVIFIFLCWQVLDSERSLSMVLAGFVAGCILVVAGTWRTYLEGQAMGDRMYEGSTRYAIEGINPNDMGATLAMGIPMAAYLALSGGRRTSYMALGYVPLAIGAIALSGSRGGTLTALAAVLGVLLWFGMRRRNALSLVLALLGAGIVLAWNLVPWEIWARIFTLREQVGGEGTAGGRTQIWRAGLWVFARHPIVGIGAGGFMDAVNPVLGSSMVAHNTLLSVATELGVIGLLLYLGAFAAALRQVLRRAGDQAAFWLTLLASWLVGSTSLTWEVRKTTWLVLLLGAAIGAMRGPSEQGELT